MNNPEYMNDKGALSTSGQLTVMNGLAVLKEAVTLNNYEKGWRSPDSTKRPVGELAALLHSEVTEAFESYRDNEPQLAYEYNFDGRKEIMVTPTYLVPGHSEPLIGKPIGMASELADVIIRVLDWADEHDVPVIQAVLEKHAYNQTRAFRHGGKLV
ncbi:pyrophosphatase [Mycobacterium phage Cuke]|uniref:Nucleotide pyrophosphohydrolase n=1 Tax=Mycobacterium phage Cuke TaxID=2079417 RepID=A0A2L1IX00_9CAUD|nr:pyrophosphatase [Mycobacterium phage Cuke]AVD99698.1 nucleotide pyrophosphohydrolase [Mycobacterium phage Cuke]